jgi:hypothetical protein
MRNFHQRMLAEFALEPWDDVDIDGVVLDVYSRMMERLIADTAALPRDRFTEISFDDLQHAPLETVRGVYKALGLDGFDAAEPKFREYLASVDGYQKNVYAYPADAVARIRERWAPFIERWGYQVPGAVAAVAG